MTSLFDDLQAALGAAYALEEELGGGGMSRVFVARETALGRRVVVKVLPPELVAGVNVERFRREIQVAAQLRHPHIVPVLAAGESDSLLYYTMPFVEGESLRGRLARQGELPVDEAIKLLREIADALSHAHRRGVVHRDIKPENVLLDEGHVQVTDFGVAKALAEAATSGGLTSVGMAVGTPAYMAPEQAAADPQTDHRADIYAFGAVAYELLTGQAPFGMRSPQALLAAHVTESPEHVTKTRPSIPSGLAALVMRCLEKRPSDRPQSAEELLRELDAMRPVRSGESPGDVPVSASRAAVGGSFPAPRVIILAASAVALALTGYFVIAGRTSNEATASASIARGDSATGSSVPASPVTTGAPVKSIAVLPFANMSADPENEYFSDGLTEDLITALSEIEGLRVAARTSSFALKRKELDVRTVGDTLNVANVLSGSVRKSGSRIRVTAQLVSATDGYELWSHSYDSELRDVFSVQDTITRAIVTALRLNLVGGSGTTLVRPPTEDLAAYELYLKGRYFWSMRTGDGLRTAVRHFEQAVARDSGYARAYAGLADSYALLGIFSHERPRDVFPQAKAAALKALQLDSTLAEARTSLGHVGCSFDFDWQSCVRDLRSAIALDPNYAFAYQLYGMRLAEDERFEEGIAMIKRALALDPLSPSIRMNLGRAYLHAGRFDDAIRQLQEALELSPQLSNAHRQLGYAYLKKGMKREAILAFQRAVQFGATRESAHLAYGYAVTGQRDEAAAILRSLLDARTQAYVSPLNIATAYAGLGEKDQSFQWLDSAFVERSGTLSTIKSLPAFAFLHPDPRFNRLLKRMGLER